MGLLEDWGAAARKPRPVSLRGNTPWARAYADEHEDLWRKYAARLPRNLQRHLGPSELGTPCHRQVAGKMAGLAGSNHVCDPWASTRGVALHAFGEGVYQWDNAINGLRWLTETKVEPDPRHRGTADLYDARWKAVVDHKFLSRFSIEKVQGDDGPPIHYKRQLKLYGRGFRNAGFPVERVVLLAWPADRSDTAKMYVWEDAWTNETDAEVDYVLNELTEYRRQWAQAITAGAAQLLDVPAAADDDSCFFCPFYRPAMAHGHVDGIGCPGGVLSKEQRHGLKSV